MPLHIIIDGYNFIRQSGILSVVDQQDLQWGRDALVDMLVAYKKVKPHKITVVFDGTGGRSVFQHRDRVKGINITFSQRGELADAVIKKMAAREKARAIIVSSDMDVVAYAASRGAATIRSPEFEKKVLLAGQFAEAGLFKEENNEGWKPTTKKKGPRRRLPKRERKNRFKSSKL